MALERKRKRNRERMCVYTRKAENNRMKTGIIIIT